MWTVLNEKDHIEAVREIEAQNDRGAAIVAASFLEERLEAAIYQRMVDDANIKGALFKGSGPLATFSAKISLAYLLGIYGDNVRKEMNLIREIRNKFAHEMRPLTFDEQSVRDKTGNFVHLPSFFSDMDKKWGDSNPWKAHREAVAAICVEPRTYRERYIKAVQMRLFYLDFAMAHYQNEREFFHRALAEAE